MEVDESVGHNDPNPPPISILKFFLRFNHRQNEGLFQWLYKLAESLAVHRLEVFPDLIRFKLSVIARTAGWVKRRSAVIA
jgi:hypothetical protein